MHVFCYRGPGLPHAVLHFGFSERHVKELTVYPYSWSALGSSMPVW